MADEEESSIDCGGVRMGCEFVVLHLWQNLSALCRRHLRSRVLRDRAAHHF